MQFSDTSTKTGIIQACERYTKLGDAGISGNTLYIKEFTALVNQIGRKVWAIIFESYGGWQYEDGNQTDLPASVTTLTADQTTYAMPSGSLSVRGIEVKNTGGVWSRLFPITEEEIRDRQAMGEFFKTSGTPLYYQMIGQTIRIFPASNWTQSSSFKVFYDRGSVAFVSTDTTATPGFISEFHDILSVGASLQYLIPNQPESPTVNLLRFEYADYEKKLKTYYTQKFAQMFPPRMTVRDSVRENM